MICLVGVADRLIPTCIGSFDNTYLAVAGVILLAVVWIRFHTAKMACKNSEEQIIPDGKTIAADYIHRGTFVIDVVSLIPFFVQVMQHAHTCLACVSKIRQFRP